MPLVILNLQGLGIKSLSSLKSMPLKELFLTNCKKLKDFSDLLHIQLYLLTLPNKPEINRLKRHPTIKKIGFTSTNILDVRKFWRDRNERGSMDIRKTYEGQLEEAIKRI